MIQLLLLNISIKTVKFASLNLLCMSISICQAKIGKISEKNFVMINKDGGIIFRFVGDTTVMRGGI